MKPKFILGLGAQKAGTSWLHAMLNNNINVNMGFMKEYHIWDYVYSDLSKNFKAPLKKPDNAGAAMRRLMQADEGIYIKYFQSLITSDVQVTGDITPSYSYLNEAALKKIAQCIEGGGFEIKVIFLMRDPIERIWSAVRMAARNTKKRGKEVDENFMEVRILEILKKRQGLLRSDYKSTVQNIEKAFHKDKVHFEIYENLFKKSSIELLSSFLGFSFDEINFDQRVNESPSAVRSEELIKEIVKILKPQYQFCNERFPITTDLWKKL